MKFTRHIALTLLCLTALGAAAQQAVESAVKTLINSKSITNEIYSERRDPMTKNIVRSDRVFNFTDSKIAAKIIEAIRKERDKASSFQMNNRPGNAAYKIVFDKEKGKYAKYTLIQERESLWMLSIIKVSGKSNKHDSSMVTDKYYDDDNLRTVGCLNDDGTELWSSQQEAAMEQLQSEFARQQAEFVRQQTEFARQQTEWARQQTEWAVRKSNQASKSTSSVARRNAEMARKCAAEARKQAAEARKEAAKARQKAAEARKKAAKSRSRSNSNSDTYIYTTPDNGNSTYSITYTRS